ncbi:MAG: hypothetical protein IT287_05640, partial [Bdellovibrionaceae bacterium]|nr:hypothetical protein [Pseudobdellovibrionaceae bacterium]
MASGKYTEAAEIFSKHAEQEQGDKLAYLLEYATALHMAGQYKESNAAFESADKMCDLNDYTSVSREAGAMIVKEGMTQYKAETFEYLMINIYQALNYLLMGDYENAQVKARKLNEKINKIELGKETKKRQTSFAAYLAGLLWESEGDYDNAHILYAKAYELDSSSEVFKKTLLVSAKLAQREDLFEKYKNQWPSEFKKIDWKSLRTKGEFVFILQQGWVPRKQQQRHNRTLPELVSVPSRIPSVNMEIAGATYRSEIIYDLDSISKKTLADDIASLAARALARQASRIAVRQASANNNDNAALAVASIASIVFDVMDVADLRQWSTLPASFQLIRIPLNPGSY